MVSDGSSKVTGIAANVKEGEINITNVSNGFIRKLHKFSDIRKDVIRPNTSGLGLLTPEYN